MRRLSILQGVLAAWLMLFAAAACMPGTPGSAAPTQPGTTATSPTAMQTETTTPQSTQISTEVSNLYPTPGIETAASPYPEPQVTATSVPATEMTGLPTVTGEPYPYPEPTGQTYPYPYPEPTQQPYPYPYPQPGSGQATPTTTPDFIRQPTPTRLTAATPTLPAGAGTAVAAQQTTSPGSATPIVLTPSPLMGRVVMSGKVVVWHSLPDDQLAVLQELVRSFVRMYPEVSFEFQQYPLEVLRQRYYSAAYLGGGPSLLIAPAEWGMDYYADDLVEDLNPYIVSQFRETILPAPLAASQVDGAQVGLPLAQTGLVLYRNTALVKTAPASMAELDTLARQATRAGRVGLFIDLGADHASGLLPYQGAQWMTDDGKPAFDSGNYEAARTWLSVLQQLDAAGGVEFHQIHSYTLFGEGRVGMTFADVSTRRELAMLLGEENLALDRWPSPLGGWIKTTAVYLNANVNQRSSTEHTSALMFIGALLNSSVQSRLAAAGLVPVVKDVQISNPLDASAYQALAGQTAAYPPAWGGDLRDVYLKVIDQMVQDVLVYGKPADQVLKAGWQTLFENIK